jgi:hypothetical protein
VLCWHSIQLEEQISRRTMTAWRPRESLELILENKLEFRRPMFEAEAILDRQREVVTSPIRARRLTPVSLETQMRRIVMRMEA